MKNFLDDTFLLNDDLAVTLYEDYAKNLPIIDFHNHLSAQELAENKAYADIAELWLAHDHYKWRAMRCFGVPETHVTGNAPGKEKFFAWAQTLGSAMGNPLYHWSHMELREYFHFDAMLDERTARDAWECCNSQLGESGLTARRLIQQSGVEVLCTCDDPAGTLDHHITLAKDDSFNVQVYPSFRPDDGMYIERPTFLPWIKRLASCTGLKIATLEAYEAALTQRIEEFDLVGCRLSDHSLETFSYCAADAAQAEAVFIRVLAGEQPSTHEAILFRSHMIAFLGAQYAKRGWAMQLHIGAIRNNNQKIFRVAGVDRGFDSIDDATYISSLRNLLDDLNTLDALPKCILYCLNPRDFEALVTMAGNFQSEGFKTKMQLGPAWWFNDNKEGIERHISVVANQSLLGCFIGMTTDSRSTLSMVRHHYFRRILCNTIASWAANGETGRDTARLGTLIQDICYYNSKRYFNV